MGTIISRKKRNAVVNSQSVAAIPGRSAEEEGTPYMGNQVTNQEPTATPGKSTDGEDTPHMANQAANQGLTVCISHDIMNESDTEEESEARDESDSEKSHDESNDDENQSAHDSVRELSVSSKSSDSVTTEASASERSKTRSALDGVSSNEDFEKGWKEALLEDLDISVSDNVKIVRIFTSSTFTDTFVERNALMVRVYPRLKSFCQERGYDFQVVDMRWGVRDESTDDHMTTDLCMRELRACQKLSTGPNFITFLGQKYGYRPFPAKIRSSEFETLLAAVEKEDDLQLLKHWFWRDDNAVPAQYLLQPITSLLPDYRNYENKELRKKASSDWWAAFERMQVVLRIAADKVLDEEERHKYHMSVTEDEIRRGIITVATPEKHCFWFKRVITDLIQNADDRNAAKFVDKTYGAEHSVIDESARGLLVRLRESELPTALAEKNVLEYKVKWTSEGISPDTSDEHAKYLDKLCTDVYNVLSSMIQEAISEKETNEEKNPVTEEVLQHALFCQRKGLACQGRDSFLSLVKRSLLDNDSKRVSVLHGESGCGKTSIMAKIAVDIRKWLEPESAIVVLRFIGTSPESSNIRMLLRSVCQQLYMITGNEITEIPEDPLELYEFFPKCLDEACNSRPVVVMLDSLDQLPAGEGGRRLDWLPRKLPDNCYFVLSTLPGSDYECLPLLKELYPDSSFMEVPTIPANEADIILESWLSSSQRSLTTDQKQMVLNAFEKCPLPLFLKLSFDETCRWKSYTSTRETKLAPSVKDIINDFLDQVERRHGKILVNQALAYVTASKNGLTEPELEDILSLDDEVLNDVYQYWTPPVRRLPPLLWIRVRSDLGDYLIERGADDARVIYWYHRQFIEVATTRYLKARKEVHTKLADFFTGIWSDGAVKPFADKNGETVLKDRLVARQPLMFHNEKENKAVYNLRKLSELPYHLLHAGNLKRLKEKTLCNFEFLLAKLRATSLEAVLDDFTASLVLYPEDEDLVTLEKTLQLSSFALKGDANQLAPQLLGRLMVGFDLVKFSGIHILLQQAYSSSVPCLIPNDKCLTSPGGSLISSIKIPGEPTTQCCGFSCDGETAYIASSFSESLQLLIINLLNGKTLQRVTIPESQGGGLVWSIQGSQITPDLLLLAGSADILLMKASNGQIVQKFAALDEESQYSPMPPVAFADNERRIVAITDKNLKIWTVKDGRLLHQIDIGKISTDEEYGSLGTSGYLAAFCVHVSGSFKVLDCRTGKMLREVSVFSEADECFITEVKVTSKEQVVVTSSEKNNLRLYDLHSGDLIREVPQFRINSGLLRLQITKDGAKAVGIHDYEILITNLEDGTVNKTLKSESFGTLIIHQNFYTRDGKYGISIAHDEVIRIYDLEKAVKENKKAVQKGSKNHKAVSSVDSITYLTRDDCTDRYVIAIATVNDTNEILIWDTFEGAKARALKVTQDLPPSTIRMGATTRAVGYIHDKDFLHFQVIDLQAGKIERRLQGKAPKRTEAFGFTDDSHIITFSRGRRNLKVWNINDGKLVSQYKFGQKFRFEDMLVSRNGNAVVCSQVGQTVEHDESTVPLAFLNPQNGEQKFLEEKGTQLLLWNGCVSDDGRYLVCLTKEYSAQLWDLTTGRMMYRLSVDEENTHVIATAISTVSNVVLTGESDGGINVWDITSGHVQYTFFCDDVDSLFITKDGRVAFANYRSNNRNIDAWDLSNGSKLASFTSDWKPERIVICGNRLVVAKADKPELMSLRPHIPGYTEDVANEDGHFMDCPLESQMQPCLTIASGEDEDEDEDDDFDQTDIQKTELTKKAVYASPNVIIGGGSSVFASKNIFISGNVTINGIPIQDL